MKRLYAGTVAALIVSSPLPFAVGSWVHGPQTLQHPSWVVLVAALAALAIAGAGLVMARQPRLGALLTSLGIVGVLALLARVLEHSPALALAIALSALIILHAIWRGALYLEPQRFVAQSILAARARGAALAALGFWVVAWAANVPNDDWISLWSLMLTFSMVGLFGLQWLMREGTRYTARVGVLLGAVLLAGLGIARSWGWWWDCISAAAIIPATMIVCLPARQQPGMGRMDWWGPILRYPERLLVATFLALCLVGTLSLALPVSSATGRGIALVNVAFTAVSAVCVTGLIVLDTPVAFSGTGQVVILVLIQLGGLGIMTFSTAAIHLLGRRMSLRHEGAVAGLISPQNRGQLFRATRRLITFTFRAAPRRATPERAYRAYRREGSLRMALCAAPLIVTVHVQRASTRPCLYIQRTNVCMARYSCFSVWLSIQYMPLWARSGSEESWQRRGRGYA